MKKLIPWDEAEEVTFECEPGTLTSHKLEAIRQIGVTRLSLGVEDFDDHILEINGRAHHSKEIARAYSFARELAFPQINIDLIAGMVEETETNAAAPTFAKSCWNWTAPGGPWNLARPKSTSTCFPPPLTRKFAARSGRWAESCTISTSFFPAAPALFFA
jgi:hypothetical protein